MQTIEDALQSAVCLPSHGAILSKPSPVGKVSTKLTDEGLQATGTA